jgi:hypothetical protein
MMKVLLPFICFLLLVSCESESIDASTLDRGEDYYPLVSGKYVEYKYDSVFYFNNGLNKVPTSGFLKEEIGKVISQTNFESKYELLRYWKRRQQDAWTLSEIESITKTKDKIIVTDENLPFMRMVFPVKEKATWAGNSLFNEDITIKIYGEDLKLYSNWDYLFSAVGKPYTFNTKKFDNCAEVIEVDKSTPLSKRYSRAVYAKGIGQLEREVYMYDTQRPQAGKPWETYTEEGYSAKIQYLNHN